MLVLANEFEIEQLKLSGFEFVIKGKCNAQNVCKLLMDSKKGVFSTLNPDDLIKRCMVFIQENTEEVFKSPDFINLDEDFIISMIKSDNLDIDEIEIFKAILKWGKNQIKIKNDDTRTKSLNSNFDLEIILKNILPHIRFVNMDGSDLVHFVKSTNLIDPNLYLNILIVQTAPNDFEDIPKLPEIKARGGSRFKWDSKFPAGNKSNFKLDSKGLTVKKCGGGQNWGGGQVYGDKVLKKGVHYWEVLLVNIGSDGSGTAVGLAESNTNKTQ